MAELLFVYSGASNKFGEFNVQPYSLYSVSPHRSRDQKARETRGRDNRADNSCFHHAGSVALVWTDAGGVIDAEQHRLRHNTGLQEPPILLSIVRTLTLILYHNGSTPLGQKSIIFPNF